MTDKPAPAPPSTPPAKEPQVVEPPGNTPSVPNGPPVTVTTPDVSKNPPGRIPVR